LTQFIEEEEAVDSQNQHGPVGLGGGLFCHGSPLAPPSPWRRFLASASVIGAFMS
jgi:hypothetical protein